MLITASHLDDAVPTCGDATKCQAARAALTNFGAIMWDGSTALLLLMISCACYRLHKLVSSRPSERCPRQATNCEY